MTEKELARAVVDAVHGELYSRKGFDAWWDQIDEQTADDIMDTMVAVATKVIKESTT